MPLTNFGASDKIGGIVKYVCCVYLEANALQGLSADERAELNRDSRDYDNLLAKRGIYIASSALQPARAAKTIRHRGGKPLVIDGPYAESKEVLGGFILIEVRNMEEAVQVAQNIPVGKFGNIEVRPEMKME